jgi:hypothetical protein
MSQKHYLNNTPLFVQLPLTGYTLALTTPKKERPASLRIRYAHSLGGFH